MSPTNDIVTISMGIATVVADDCPTMDSQRLFEQADKALYQLKKQGRNGFRSYHSQPTSD